MRLVGFIIKKIDFTKFVVTLAKQKNKTPWRWCRCIETCRSAYDI